MESKCWIRVIPKEHFAFETFPLLAGYLSSTMSATMINPNSSNHIPKRRDLFTTAPNLNFSLYCYLPYLSPFYPLIHSCFDLHLTLYSEYSSSPIPTLQSSNQDPSFPSLLFPSSSPSPNSTFPRPFLPPSPKFPHPGSSAFAHIHSVDIHRHAAIYCANSGVAVWQVRGHRLQ